MGKEVITVVARSDNTTFNIGAPPVGQQKTDFTFNFNVAQPALPTPSPLPNGGIGKGIFTSYEFPMGSVQSYWAFDADSSIYIQAAKVSIPNLRGIKHIQTVTESYDLFLSAIRVGGGLSVGTTKTLTDFDEWQIYQKQLGLVSTSGIDWFLAAPNSMTVGLDTRNVNPAYDGISCFLQIELQIIAPLGMKYIVT